MKKLYGYIRVSTKKQGDGVSLDEQKRIIQEFARKEGHTIVRFFEEQVTAAKEGRPQFNIMVNLLLKKKADGVVMHKVDRSSRNFGDWHKIGKLVDRNIDVFYAHSNTDLSKRGDRLTADIELVIAADYIRNLSSEVKKGIYGRLKQGLLPLPAPVGYLDTGKGNPKVIDPIKAPLIRKAFELYATGEYSLKALSNKMYDLGLRSKKEKRITFTNLSKILNNPFYYGVIRIKKTDEVFKGVHKPIISKRLFERVKMVLGGKTPRRVIVHDFAFRRCIKCVHCKYSLIGELQKGRIYYRCQIKECPTKTIREDRLVQQLLSLFRALSLSSTEQVQITQQANDIALIESEDMRQKKKTLSMMIQGTHAKIDKLTDTLISGVVDEDTYRRKKNELTEQLVSCEQSLDEITSPDTTIAERVEQFLELLKSLNIRGNTVSNHIIRKLVFEITSNLYMDGRNIAIQPYLPFEKLLYAKNFQFGAACAGKGRKNRASNCSKRQTLIYLSDLDDKMDKKELSKQKIESLVNDIINHQPKH